MRERPPRPWPFGPRTDTETRVRPLRPADVPGLRLPWTSRFSAGSLAAHVAHRPDHAWMGEGGEYLVAEPWRRRDKIAAILELHARRARGALLDQAAADLRAAGTRLLLLPEGEWTAQARLYREQGFARLEKVVYYQLAGLAGAPAPTRPLPPLDLAPLTAHNLATVVALDHAAFPWLWWNSAAEFQAYHGSAGVEVWLGWAAGVPVAYAGCTRMDRWGHLDRLAVDPAAQGHGYGAAMLAFVVGRLAAFGVTRVTLSTQETNFQSQRLYQGFGFRQTTETYALFGRWLGDEVVSRQSSVVSDE